ncbi:MAG: hypothetical protein FWC79_07435 [Oscillospiraceae bacterium]|nr:hypothetical protein [Oscillospiraceae bacterium]
MCGIIFLLAAISFNIDILSLNIERIAYLLIQLSFISTLLLIAGVDIKRHTIAKAVMLTGLIIKFSYVIYLYILGNNVHGYIIYIIAILLLLIIDTIYLKKRGKEIYPVLILTLCMYIALWAQEDITILSIMLALWAIVIRGIPINPNRMKNKEVGEEADKQKMTRIPTKIPIGAYLCLSSIAVVIFSNFVR